jgi:hypothetical protein
MSRKKVRYTKDEITNNLYTTGQEWMTTDNEDYIGLYHRYSTGEVYTNAKWNPRTSIPLIKFRLLPKGNKSYKKINKDIVTLYNSLQPARIEITQKNINSGYIDRYFALNIVSNNIMEITSDQKKMIDNKKIDPNLYITTSLRWYITGNLESAIQNGVTIKSVPEKNNDEIITAAKTIPRISTVLTKLTEYYSDTTYIVPKDINPIG